MLNKKIILIGGAPTTGKSTLAKDLSAKLGLPWMSTDHIREIMRTATNIKDTPLLFEPEGYDAQKFLTEFSAEKIAQMEYEQGVAVWPGISKIIRDDYTWRDGFVIEGVNILPSLVAKDFGRADNVKAVFVYDDNLERIRKVVYERGLWSAASHYKDTLKEKEVEWVLAYNKIIEKEASTHGFPYIKLSKNSDDCKQLIMHI